MVRGSYPHRTDGRPFFSALDCGKLPHLGQWEFSLGPEKTGPEGPALLALQRGETLRTLIPRLRAASHAAAWTSAAFAAVGSTVTAQSHAV